MPVEPYDLWVHPLPPSIAAYFTRAQLAAIRVINEEVMEHGVCELSMDALADRAMMVTAPRVVTAHVSASVLSVSRKCRDRAARAGSQRVLRIRCSVLLLDALQTAWLLPDWRETAPAHMPEQASTASAKCFERPIRKEDLNTGARHRMDIEHRRVLMPAIFAHAATSVGAARK